MKPKNKKYIYVCPLIQLHNTRFRKTPLQTKYNVASLTRHFLKFLQKLPFNNFKYIKMHQGSPCCVKTVISRILIASYTHSK